jgi:predicted Zn-ribbon and HTH transcriptional regulator
MYSVLDSQKHYANVGKKMISFSQGDDVSNKERSDATKYGVGLDKFYKETAKEEVTAPNAVKQPRYTGGDSGGAADDAADDAAAAEATEVERRTAGRPEGAKETKESILKKMEENEQKWKRLTDESMIAKPGSKHYKELQVAIGKARKKGYELQKKLDEAPSRAPRTPRGGEARAATAAAAPRPRAKSAEAKKPVTAASAAMAEAVKAEKAAAVKAEKKESESEGSSSEDEGVPKVGGLKKKGKKGKGKSKTGGATISLEL